ncbi:hypothetical protein FRC01_007574 [Tulasnella sp. 417]|nr:hypothetical protein FRC01_007574 [Tulasnella sp. 417]
MNYYNPAPRRQDTSYIGRPIHYAHGPNAGKTIRAELSEYQKPDLGRKFAKRDRRPLDPPPVVRVRLWEVFDAGLPSQTERELAAEDVEVQGLVAHVDLFRANNDGSVQVDSPTETASLTKHCFGSSFVHATHILDLTGQPAIIFVFADLSVRLEGVFALRYRIFDLVRYVYIVGIPRNGPSTKKGAAKGGRAKASAAKAPKPKAVRPSGISASGASHSQTHASFSDFQTLHQADAAGPSAVPESVSQLQSTSGHLGSVTPTSTPRNHPQSAVGIDDKTQTRDQDNASGQQLFAPPTNWSRGPQTSSGEGWSRTPTNQQQPISNQPGPISGWNQRPTKQVTDPTNAHQHGGQDGAGPSKEPSRKRARMTIPGGTFDTDAAPGLSQASPEDVANLSISSSGRMLPAGNSMSMSQSPNFMVQQSQTTNFHHPALAASYTPSQPPALVPAQRTNSFSPGNTFAMQPPNPVPVSTGHLATQSPISMHSSAPFAIPSSTPQYGYRNAR